jgi:hypothetical protein
MLDISGLGRLTGEAPAYEIGSFSFEGFIYWDFDVWFLTGFILGSVYDGGRANGPGLA